jgi:CheY-like chemotaxis protein
MARFESSARVSPPLVLIVDDEVDFRECLSGCLRDEGFRTAVACDGADALGLLATGLRPALIILDQMMPGMQGTELLGMLRADASTSSIPVILSSASLIDDATVPGATAVVRKPFELDAMLTLINRLLAAGQDAAPAAS